MPRTASLIALALFFVAGCEANFHCSNELEADQIPEAICYTHKCTTAIQNHIKEEFNAAFTYLAMGAYFASQSVNRPGIAKFLLTAASEERSHAIQMLDYLNKRGINLTEDNSQISYKAADKEIIKGTKLNKLESIEYKDALIQALNMEMSVTQFIYNVIKACATDHDDFHGADVFTNPILDEQHEGIRHLQGAIKIFNNLAEETGDNDEYKKYAEYIFDMKLLKGEIAAH